MARNSQQEKKESMLEVALMFSAAFLIIFALIWFLGSTKIVYYTAGMLRVIAWPWYLIDREVWGTSMMPMFFTKQGRMQLAFTTTCCTPTIAGAPGLILWLHGSSWLR